MNVTLHGSHSTVVACKPTAPKAIVMLTTAIARCGAPVVYRVAQKSKPPPIFQKIVLKLSTGLDFFVKLKYESSTIIQSVGNKYSVRDLLL